MIYRNLSILYLLSRVSEKRLEQHMNKQLNVRYRLMSRGWKPGIVTSTHELWYKKDWQCSISRRDGEVKFQREKLFHLEVMRGPVERGIE